MMTWTEMVNAAGSADWKVIQGRLFPFPHLYTLQSGTVVPFQTQALVLWPTRSQTPATQGFPFSRISAYKFGL